ncbi:MAG: c-type cytochrome, partial [Planctomycetota bacterium]
FLLGFWTYIDKQIAPSNAIELKVSGWKWGWNITYPDGEESPWQVPLDPGHTVNNGAGVPVFVVPENTPIKLRMSSQDVLHSFWIPDFRVKMDLFPNRYTGYTFKTPELKGGDDYQDHWIFCAEYCGDFHAEMGAILRVVPKTEYGTILASWDVGNKSPVEIGQAVAAGRCYICHSIDGSAGTGPTWLNLYGYEQPMADGSQVLADEDYLRESILVPTAKIHAGYPANMPSFQGQLSEAQLDGVIQYIRTLSDKWEPPVEGEGEVGDGDAASDDTADDAEDAPADDEAQANAETADTPSIEAITEGVTPAPTD